MHVLFSFSSTVLITDRYEVVCLVISEFYSYCTLWSVVCTTYMCVHLSVGRSDGTTGHCD